jgi:hypothetical protein
MKYLPCGPEGDFDAAFALQVEWVEWRREQSLQPSPRDLRRLGRWTRWAARRSGLVFAPWAEDL